jgi:hypothetical protein
MLVGMIPQLAKYRDCTQNFPIGVLSRIACFRQMLQRTTKMILTLMRIGPNLTTAMLKAYVGQADCCKEPLRTGHSYSRFASAIAGAESRDRLKRFLESLGRHDWATLRAFNEWSSQSDNLVAHVIKCPSGRGMMAAVIDPVDLYANPYLLAKSPLDEKEVQYFDDLLRDAEWLFLS